MDFYARVKCKSKYCLIAVCIVLAAVLLSYIAHENRLHFSHEPGFYSENFYLEIKGQLGCDIYYTLDGSTPTQESLLYEEPILVEDASFKENVYAARTDVSTGFLKELVETYSYDMPGGYALPDYEVPDYKVDKGTVLRAVMYNAAGEPVSELTGTFFVGDRIRNKYRDVRVVSVITDPENLFDYEKGIYVTGKAFEEFQTAGEYNAGWSAWKSNYSIHGREMERTAHIEIFEKEENLLSANCGIRIQGGATRGFLPKSLSVYSRNEYSGSEEFQTELFEDGIQPHKLVLTSGGNDNKGKLRDYMIQSMEQELNFATMDYTPCVVFLDGEFWGAYHLTESYNADYVHDHYGVAEDNVILVEAGLLAEGTGDDNALYEEMRTFIMENDMSEASNYEQAKELIDVESYIDYYAAQIYRARTSDWPFGNEAAWRSRKNSLANPYEDGKWRWMLYDVNSAGVHLYHLQDDTLGNVLEMEPVFASLFRNDEFKQAFVARLLYMADEIYTEEKCDTFIENYLELMTPVLLESNRRFYGGEQEEVILENAEEVRTFFRERKEVVLRSIEKHAGKEYLESYGLQT